MLYRDLYTVWSEKPHFMLTAANLNVFNSSYFLWLDIGAVRHSVNIKLLYGNIKQYYGKIVRGPDTENWLKDFLRIQVCFS